MAICGFSSYPIFIDVIISDKLIEGARDKADLVIIGGDIRERGVPIERVEKNILKLKELGPLYFVWGNNDYEGDFHELGCNSSEAWGKNA